MKLNLRRYSNSLNKNTILSLIQPGKSFLELILEAFENLLGGNFLNHRELSEETNSKTTPEGSKGLTAWDSINPNGIPQVTFSDGNGLGYCDYRKLQQSTDEQAKQFCKTIDHMLASGLYKLVTMYKPDGATFETFQPVQPPLEATQSKKLRKYAQKTLAL